MIMQHRRRRTASTSMRRMAGACALFFAITACSGAVERASDPETSGTSPEVPSTTLSDQTTTGPADSASSESSAVETTMPPDSDPEPRPAEIALGVERLVTDGFAPLQGRRVGLITNQVSVVDGRHLIDWMHEDATVELVRIFAAEHGVRGVAGAGEPIGDGVDDTTGVEILSLYGATREPTQQMLEGIDTIVFDLQDVGTRYYTYTATMGLAMQAAAAADVAFVVLDRPNPQGRVVEGDLRVDAQTSFISQYPTPSLHGLTSGELARMIIGEAWLSGLDDLDLEVIPMSGWAGEVWSATDAAWIPPSPGLQTPEAASSYPTVVWFEATTLSYGAGTDRAFQAVGAPWLDVEAVLADLETRALPGVRFEAIELSPSDIIDVVVDPRFEGENVPGIEVIITNTSEYRPSATGLHLLEAIINSADGRTVIDRDAVFDLLAGTGSVRSALLAGVPVADITAGWEDVAAEFQARSFAYLLYP